MTVDKEEEYMTLEEGIGRYKKEVMKLMAEGYKAALEERFPTVVNCAERVIEYNRLLVWFEELRERRKEEGETLVI